MQYLEGHWRHLQEPLCRVMEGSHMASAEEWLGGSKEMEESFKEIQRKWKGHDY